MVEPPVSRLNKAAMILVVESPAFKDPADRMAESAARNMFTIAGSVLRPVLTIALVSQTLN